MLYICVLYKIIPLALIALDVFSLDILHSVYLLMSIPTSASGIVQTISSFIDKLSIATYLLYAVTCLMRRWEEEEEGRREGREKLIQSFYTMILCHFYMAARA